MGAPLMTAQQADELRRRGLISHSAYQAFAGPPEATPQAPSALEAAFNAQGMSLNKPTPAPVIHDATDEEIAAFQGGPVAVGTTNTAPGVSGLGTAPAPSAAPPADGPGATAPSPSPAAPAPSQATMSAAARPAGGVGGKDPRLAGLEAQEKISNEQERPALEAMAQAGKDRAAADHAAIQAGVAETKRLQAEDAVQRDKENAAIESRVADVDRAISAYGAQKTDPQRLWHQADTGSKILGMVGVLAGSIAGSLNGTNRNQAMEFIERQMDRDLRAQEVDANKQGRMIDAKRGALHDMTTLTQSKQAARAAAKVAAWDGVQQQLMAQASKYNVDTADPKFQMTLADLDKRRQAARTEYQVTIRNESRAGAAAANAQAYQRTKDERQYQLEVADRRIAAAKAQGDGSPTSPQNRRAAYDADRLDALGGFDEAVKNLPANGTGWMPSMSDSARTYDAATTRVMNAVRKPGDSSETDAARLRMISPQPGDSPQVIEKKRAMLNAALLSKHPIPELVNQAQLQANPNAAVGAVPVK